MAKIQYNLVIIRLKKQSFSVERFLEKGELTLHISISDKNVLFFGVSHCKDS